MGSRTKQTVKRRAKAHQVRVLRLRRRKSKLKGAARRHMNQARKKRANRTNKKK